MSSGEFYIKCNKCKKHLDATAIRTACNHLFCLACASGSFSTGATCPICNTTLTSKHIGEVIVGISPMPVKQCMLQFVMQNLDWESIGNAVEHIRQSSEDVTQFIQKQLLYEAASNHHYMTSVKEQLNDTKADLVGMLT